jgi:CopG family nickel-responsive transcriptional regulator
MSDLERVSVSIERPLLERLQALCAESGYTNRSEFIRDLVRERLVQREWAADEEVIGTITLLYDHHTRGLAERLTQVQHDFGLHVLATTHLHLTHELCAEMIMIRGRAGELQKILGAISELKGVLHSAMSRTSAGRFVEAHSHPHNHAHR